MMIRCHPVHCSIKVAPKPHIMARRVLRLKRAAAAVSACDGINGSGVMEEILSGAAASPVARSVEFKCAAERDLAKSSIP